jgi:O-antigen/teichoic acid export membrane protein
MGIGSQLNPLRSTHARGAAWGISDQAVSSGGNFLLTIAAARAASASGFGAFTLVLATHYIVLTSSRAFVSMPLMMTKARAPEEVKRLAQGSVSVATTLGVLVGAVLLCIGLIVGGPIGSGFLVYAVICPMLLVQDSLRFALQIIKGPKHTAINDAIWTCVQVILFLPCLLHVWSVSPFGYLAIWGLSAGAAAIVALLMLRIRPLWRVGIRFVREHWSTGSALLLEGLAASGGGQLAWYALAVVAGLEAVGHLQAAAVVFGPVNIVMNGVLLVAIPPAVRIANRSYSALWRACLGAGAALALVAVLATVGACLVPESVGHAILGASWVGAILIIPTGLAFAASAMTLGAMIGYRAIGVAIQTMWLQIGWLPVNALAAVGGYWLYGTPGAAYGMALATTVFAGILWHQLYRRLQKMNPQTAT